VVKTKGELYDFLGRRGESLVFINVDNERLMDILPDNVWVAPYSSNVENVEGCTCGEVVACAPFLKFRWRESDTNLEERGEQPQWYEVQTQLIGSYNLDNMMAAIAVGLNFGVEPAQINEALAAYKPTNNRSQLTVTAKNRLVVDAYNANPSSMRAALENFRLMEGGPKMAILGMMGELGKSSQKEHQKIVDFIGQCDLDEVWLVGSEFQAIESPYRKFADVDEVKAALAAAPVEGRLILIKGSNSTKLFQLPELL
jgi:UDP-N-acetylmuramoyl-tripeptide--D-alanyl-D-alanine ligase